MPDPCSVDACRNPATWRIRFTNSKQWYKFCDWHATRRRDKLVWRDGDIAEAEEI